MQMQGLALVLTHFLKDYFFPNTLKQWFSSYYMNSVRKKMFSFRLKRPSSPQFHPFNLTESPSLHILFPPASLRDRSQKCTENRHAVTRCISQKIYIMPPCHYPTLTLSEQSHLKSIFQEHPPQHD